MGEGLKPPAEIDADRLAEEAGSSEHGEVYLQLGRLNGVSVGVGARMVTRRKPGYFIEFLIPVCRGSDVDLDRLAWTLEVLKRLEEGGYALTCEDDMSFSCELTIPVGELRGEYERAVSHLSRS